MTNRSTPAFLFAALILAHSFATGEARAQEDFQYRGSPDAPVVMTVYSDFECPYCRNFALAALPALIAEFVDRGLVRLRYVNFPLAGIHKNAVSAALAAHCAGRAGRFWSYHDYLFVRQPEFSGAAAPDSLWISYAENLGLDAETFARCLQADDSFAAVEAELRESLEAGATGTPTIVLNGVSIAGIGSFEGLRREILAAIKAARAAAEASQ